MFISPTRKAPVSTRTSWRFLIAENLVTTSLVVPILAVYSLSLGLTLSDIGVVDVISSTVYLLLNIPIGWIADRLSRKICNLLGDAIYGASLVTLGFSTSISGVITAYILMSLGAACSQGADVALQPTAMHLESTTGIRANGLSKHVHALVCLPTYAAAF